MSEDLTKPAAPCFTHSVAYTSLDPEKRLAGTTRDLCTNQCANHHSIGPYCQFCGKKF